MNSSANSLLWTLNFIASITYYIVNYLSPITNLLIQKQVMRESIEKQKKNAWIYRSLIRNLLTGTYNFVYYNGTVLLAFIHSAKSKKFSTLKLTLSLTRSIKVHGRALVPFSMPSLWKIRKRILQFSIVNPATWQHPREKPRHVRGYVTSRWRNLF